MKFSFGTALLAFVFLFGLPLSASATTLFTEPTQFEVTPGQEFQVDVFLDTQNEDINALEGSVVFPTSTLELKEVRAGSSIVNFWVEQPIPAQAPVRFSGIIPGGYNFPKGLVVSLIFAAKQEGKGNISIENARTLLNDGKGTQSQLAVSFSSFVVSKTVSKQLPPVAKITDADPPEAFMPQLARDPSIFDGKWFLSFATQDKGSGVDHFEIKESYIWGAGNWVRGESPYVLQAQDPSRQIFVKAVDKAGNERIAMVPVQHLPLSFYEIVALFGILLIVIATYVIVYRKSNRSFSKKQ